MSSLQEIFISALDSRVVVPADRRERTWWCGFATIRVSRGRLGVPRKKPFVAGSDGNSLEPPLSGKTPRSPLLHLPSLCAKVLSSVTRRGSGRCFLLGAEHLQLPAEAHEPAEGRNNARPLSKICSLRPCPRRVRRHDTPAPPTHVRVGIEPRSARIPYQAHRRRF
jgi:hypothetical protein